MAKSAWSISTSHASSETSPQASPAISVSRSPLTATGRPARKLSNQQADRSGSASTIVGRRAPHRRLP